jgi:hypothetical protein
VTALPPQPSASGARPAVAVASCPSPPSLLPAPEERADAGTPELRRACGEAVEACLLDGPGSAGARIGVGPADVRGPVDVLPGLVGVPAVGDGSARRHLRGPGSLAAAAPPVHSAGAEGTRPSAVDVATWRAVGAARPGRMIAAHLRHDAAPSGGGYRMSDRVAS